MSCHLSRISYELFTKCVTTLQRPVSRIYALNNLVTTHDTFEHFKIFATTWHAVLYLTCIPTHLHAVARTLSRVLLSLARQIACHGVQYSCRACVRLTYRPVYSDATQLNSTSTPSPTQLNCRRRSAMQLTQLNSVQPISAKEFSRVFVPSAAL